MLKPSYFPEQSVSFTEIQQASNRLNNTIKKTPIFQSKLLNEWLGHDIYFKAECLQTIGAFKLRGAYNYLAKMAENDCLPKNIVANSSGNHAQAVAYAGSVFSIPVTIYAGNNISPIKVAATKHYGAKVKLFESREEADIAVRRASLEPDTVWIPPFNHVDIVAGQGTLALEIFEQIDHIDALFAPCGGGGLLAGSLVCARNVSPHTKVIGAEPLAANDAARSLKAKEILRLNSTPKTLADGAATPAVGDITFPYLQQLDGFYEVNEQQIAYWTQWLQHLLKLHIEPTCAMTMQGTFEWLKAQKNKQSVVVILSGGNISTTSMQAIWKHDYLTQTPDSL